MSHFLIVGTGRSGTGYCAAVLRVCNVRCGHQSVFRHEFTLRGSGWDWADWEGDCSFEAVPLLEEIVASEPDIKIVLVTRRKEDTVRSWLRLGAFSDAMMYDFPAFVLVLDRHFPAALQEPTPEARAGLYWELWNAHAARFASAHLQLEETPPRDLFRVLGLEGRYDPAMASAVSRRCNTRPGAEE